MFKFLQKIGKAFMLPIAILPAAGLLLGIGGALSNPVTVATYPVLNNDVLQAIFKVMSQAGGSYLCKPFTSSLCGLMYRFSKT